MRQDDASSDASTDSRSTNSGSANVLLLFSSGDIGGAERSLSRMALTPIGDTLTYEFATVAAEGEWTKWIRAQGRSCVAFKVYRGSKVLFAGLRSYVQFCRARRPDVVYAIGLRAAWVATIGRLFSPRTRLVHGLRSTYPKGSEFARTFGRNEKILRHFAHGYIANSKRGADDLLAIVPRIPSHQMTVIPNGVVVPQHAPPARVRRLAVSVVANIIGYKGHTSFLEVIEIVRARVPGVEVLLVGRNDLEGALEMEIQSRGLMSTVKLMGYQSDPELLVREVRVSALPSQQVEGCPTAVLESMSLGIPVVAYDVGGIAEIIENGRSGVLVPRGDANAFADALVDLLTNERQNDEIGRAARETIRQKFSLEVCAHRHASYWSSLLQSSPMSAAS